MNKKKEIKMITIDMNENKIALIIRWLQNQTRKDVTRIIDKYELYLEVEDVFHGLVGSYLFQGAIILSEEDAKNIRVWLKSLFWCDVQYVIDKYDLELDSYEVEEALFDLYCGLDDKLEELDELE